MRALPLLLFIILCGPSALPAQPTRLSLPECIAYAIDNAPALRAQREELRLTELDNRIALTDWYPQLNVSGNGQHYFQLPVSIFPDFENPQSGELREVEIGTVNNATLTFGLNQTIYNPTVAAALRSRTPLVEATRLEIERAEIDLAERIATAFYEAVRAEERLEQLAADLRRQERALRDARLLYEEGIESKVDYKRATITRNRTETDLENAVITRQNRIVLLKQLMGYPEVQPLEPAYDIEAIAVRITGDSLPPLATARRVELRQLRVQDELLRLEGLFYRRSWLPSLSLGGSYNLNWQSNALGDLFDRMFPNSLVSLNTSVPLFSGGRRFRQLERQEVLRSQLSLEVLTLRDRIRGEYQTARGDYLRALNTYEMGRENVALAREIYEAVDLRYREGIAPFLEVVVAENDLQAARLERTTGLVDAALARVQVERAAGTLVQRFLE